MKDFLEHYPPLLNHPPLTSEKNHGQPQRSTKTERHSRPTADTAKTCPAPTDHARTDHARAGLTSASDLTRLAPTDDARALPTESRLTPRDLTKADLTRAPDPARLTPRDPAKADPTPTADLAHLAPTDDARALPTESRLTPRDPAKAELTSASDLAHFATADDALALPTDHARSDLAKADLTLLALCLVTSLAPAPTDRADAPPSGESGVTSALATREMPRQAQRGKAVRVSSWRARCGRPQGERGGQATARLAQLVSEHLKGQPGLSPSV